MPFEPLCRPSVAGSGLDASKPQRRRTPAGAHPCGCAPADHADPCAPANSAFARVVPKIARAEACDPSSRTARSRHPRATASPSRVAVASSPVHDTKSRMGVPSPSSNGEGRTARNPARKSVSAASPPQPNPIRSMISA